MRSLDHKSILSIHRIYEDATFVHIVMDLAQGGDLYDAIVERGPLSESEAAEVTLRLLNALTYLRSKRIIHRDIKLENILLGREVTDIRISDFGLATKARSSKRTCGSPGYLAPEIFKSQNGYTSQVDMYSAGIVLYAMLSGEHPFAPSTVT